MKKLDRLTTILSIFLAKFLILFGILFYMNADDFVIYFISILGLLLIIFYLSFEVVSEELSAICTSRKKQTGKQCPEQENLVAFRRLFGVTKMERYEEIKKMCMESGNVVELDIDKIFRPAKIMACVIGGLTGIVLGAATMSLYKSLERQQKLENSYVSMAQEENDVAKGTSLDDTLIVSEQPVYANQCLYK